MPIKFIAATFIMCMLLAPAYAQLCKVYGISDGPQKLTCQFAQYELELSCKKGKYYLNQSPVNVAFHMDVEEGAVPLIFKSDEMKLTVLMERTISAELERSKATVSGLCRH